MKSWMQSSRFFRYENCVVQKMTVRCGRENRESPGGGMRGQGESRGRETVTGGRGGQSRQECEAGRA